MEIDPASDNCQRWNRRQHSWRHRSDGGFDRDRYTVEPIDRNTATGFVVQHHYSASYPSCKFRFGLFDADEQLVGVLVYSTPTNDLVLTNPLPELEPSSESIELGRLVLLDEVPANAESWFIARCNEEAAARGMLAVLSMSDPKPRKLDGRIIMPGHVGVIYQASNATYIGRSKAATEVLLPNGRILNGKTQEKIRGQKRGHVYSEAILTDLGARPMRDNERTTNKRAAAWMWGAVDAVGGVRVRNRGKHRYVFSLGTKSQRRRLRIANDPLPYPKEVDAA